MESETIFAIIALITVIFMMNARFFKGIRYTSSVTKEDDEIMHPAYETHKILPADLLKNYFYRHYTPRHLEKCENCGSTIFRVYNEPVENGLYIQLFCAKCNARATGVEVVGK